jgi:hypothetical protein
VIAGIPLSAQLPTDLGLTGETLRLTVSDVTPERVTVQLDQVVNPAAQPPPQAADRVRVTIHDPPRSVRAGGEERSTVALAHAALGDEVPEALWTAVAEPLAWAYSVGDATITPNR